MKEVREREVRGCDTDPVSSDPTPDPGNDDDDGDAGSRSEVNEAVNGSIPGIVRRRGSSNRSVRDLSRKMAIRTRC